MKNDWNLKFFETGEWQACEERLKDLEKANATWNPGFNNIWRSLSLCRFDHCKVAIMGQDPYPNHDLAMGLAFSVPSNAFIPPTLNMIFDEYESDLHYPRPVSGDLSEWARRGVLLWNVTPTCTAGHSLSHNWVEYELLNQELISKLNKKGIVFIFLGSRARAYTSLVDQRNNIIIETSHPSPRGNLKSNTPFTGSKIFTRANDGLVKLGKEPIDWRLP